MDDTPILFAQAGPLNGQQWVVEDDLVIGRDHAVDIVVPDRQISRHHARVTATRRGCLLEDLGSKNGTHVNGTGVHEGIFLNDGDVIQVALAQEFVFVSADSTVPLNQGSAGPQRAEKKLYLESRSRRVWVGDLELVPALSVAQFTILETLYRQEGRVVSREQLTEQVWGADQVVDISDQALDALIRRLRNRLADLDDSHDYILTVRGHGLRLDNPEK
jgi:DNA-binding response OmpR family regulator